MSIRTKLTEAIKARKARVIATLVLLLTTGAGKVSAATINWTEISDILTGVGTDLFPALVTMITAAVPILIIIAIIGFILGFLDKILDMLKLK